MSIVLNPELEKIVEGKVASGRYSSAAEVLREALQLMVERDRFLEMQHEALRRDVQAGLDQLDRGEGETPTAKDIMEKIHTRLGSKQP